MDNLRFDLWVKKILTPPLKHARKRAPKFVLAALIFEFPKNESFSCVRKLPSALTIFNTQRSPQVGWLLFAFVFVPTISLSVPTPVKGGPTTINTRLVG